MRPVQPTGGTRNGSQAATPIAGKQPASPRPRGARSPSGPRILITHLPRSASAGSLALLQNSDGRNTPPGATLAALSRMPARACIGLGGSSTSISSALSAPNAAMRRSAASGRTLAHQHSRGPLPTHNFGRSCPVKLHKMLRSPRRRARASLRRCCEKAHVVLGAGNARCWLTRRCWCAARACWASWASRLRSSMLRRRPRTPPLAVLACCRPRASAARCSGVRGSAATITGPGTATASPASDSATISGAIPVNRQADTSAVRPFRRLHGACA